MSAEKLEFDLTVNNNSLGKALDDGSKKAGILEGALSTALGVFGGGLALKGFEFLGEKIGDVVDFAQESVVAFSEQEDALNRLGQALRASGSYSGAAMESFSKFASEMQKASKFGDETVLSQVAVAKSFGATNAGAKDLVQAAANLSATFGGGLEENVDKLGKTLSGTTGRLAMYIPELKNLTKEQLAAGEAARIINEKFSGAAANELNTYTGRVALLKNAYSDMQEEIGSAIANSSLLKDAQALLTSTFQKLSQAVADYNTENDRSQNGYMETETSLEQLGRKYSGLTGDIEELEKKAAKLPGGLDNFDASKLKIYRQELSDLETQVNNAAIEVKVNDTKDALGKGPEKGPAVPQDVLDSRAKLNAELLNLEQQQVLEENNVAMEGENAKIENDLARQQAELQRITDFNATKTELEYQMKEAQLATMQDGLDKDLEMKKLAQEKELALLKIKNDGIVKSANLTRDAEKKASAERVAQAQQTAAILTGIVAVSANIASVMMKDGSKEAFYVQKAAALAQAGVATWLAMAQANALPPPTNGPAMVAAKVNGAIAISGIAASTLKGFATGGIIGDENGATMGPDNVTINARKGEMMLNGDQQKTVFDALQNGNLGGDRPIIIQIDGREVFRAVRERVRAGERLDK